MYGLWSFIRACFSCSDVQGMYLVHSLKWLPNARRSLAYLFFHYMLLDAIKFSQNSLLFCFLRCCFSFLPHLPNISNLLELGRDLKQTTPCCFRSRISNIIKKNCWEIGNNWTFHKGGPFVGICFSKLCFQNILIIRFPVTWNNLWHELSFTSRLIAHASHLRWHPEDTEISNVVLVHSGKRPVPCPPI